MMNKEKTGGMMRIILPQTFDVEEASKFRNEIYQMFDKQEKRFVIDFMDCQFIDSTGLGVMVSVYKRCMELQGSIKLCSINSQVFRVFQLTRLDKVFDIYPSFEVAIKS